MKGINTRLYFRMWNWERSERIWRCRSSHWSRKSL